MSIGTVSHGGPVIFGPGMTLIDPPKPVYKLPEIEIGQVWASFFIASSGNIFNGRYRVINYTPNDVLPWELECILGGDLGRRICEKVDFRTLTGTYYVGDKDNKDAHNINYKPEPAVGQLWLSKNDPVNKELRLKEFNSNPPACFHLEDGRITMGNLRLFADFIGWFDCAPIVSSIDLSKYPHKCSCGAAAYIGLNQIDCSKKCRK